MKQAARKRQIRNLQIFDISNPDHLQNIPFFMEFKQRQIRKLIIITKDQRNSKLIKKISNIYFSHRIIDSFPQIIQIITSIPGLFAPRSQMPELTNLVLILYFFVDCKTIRYLKIQYGVESFLIQWALISFNAILDFNKCTCKISLLLMM